MEKLPSKRAARPDLMPWQASLMILCVTMAGVMHEHPGALRPMMGSLQTVQFRAGMAHVSHSADALNTVVWRGR